MKKIAAFVSAFLLFGGFDATYGMEEQAKQDPQYQVLICCLGDYMSESDRYNNNATAMLNLKNCIDMLRGGEEIETAEQLFDLLERKKDPLDQDVLSICVDLLSGGMNQVEPGKYDSIIQNIYNNMQ